MLDVIMMNSRKYLSLLSTLLVIAACAMPEPEIKEISEAQSTIKIDRKLISVRTGLVAPSASHLAATGSQSGGKLHLTVLEGQDIIGEVYALQAGSGYVYGNQPIPRVVEPSWLDEDQTVEWYGVQQSTGSGFGVAQYRQFRIDEELDCIGFMAGAGSTDDIGQRSGRYYGYFCVIAPEMMTPQRAQTFLDAVSFKR